jgi:hypothetical protein
MGFNSGFKGLNCCDLKEWIFKYLFEDNFASGRISLEVVSKIL